MQAHGSSGDAAPGSRISAGTKPVSYTHLDVYKRQAQDIRSGALQPGKALPGRRTMAAQLGISTNTVDTAYQMLAAERCV